MSDSQCRPSLPYPLDCLNEIIESQRPGYTLDQCFYKDPNIFQLDLDIFFFNHWVFIGHVSRIPNIGDYFLFETGNESVIIIRGKNNEIHAHHNVCRHRGSRVYLENSGNTIIVASKRGSKKYVACLVQANARLDVNKVVTRLMDVKRASFASADETKEITGMLIGGVTPFGLPDDMPIYVDENIKGLDFIILGSGDRSSKFKLAGSELSKIPNVEFISGLSAVKQS